MAKKGKRNSTRVSKKTEAPVEGPFAGLRKLKKQMTRPGGAAIAVKAHKIEPVSKEGEERSFAEAMEDVHPIKKGKPRVAKKPPEPPTISKPPVRNDDLKMLQEMGLWMEKKVDFQIADDAERIEGSVTGLDLKRRRKLRKGGFAVQADLDLHGLDTKTAEEETQRFILEAVRAHHRCVLIIHGKGLHSKTDQPVIKQGISKWLTRGATGRCVLAFTTALPCDGGHGAIYILLRKSRAHGDGKKAIIRQE